jgi:hypothetical protein
MGNHHFIIFVVGEVTKLLTFSQPPVVWICDHFEASRRNPKVFVGKRSIKIRFFKENDKDYITVDSRCLCGKSAIS